MSTIPYQQLEAVLFDLDGTLLDTAPDLGGALNALLRAEGLEVIDDDTIRPIASHGAKGLIDLGFGADLAEARFHDLRQRFLDHYENNLCEASVLFDGARELIGHLQACGIAWGIVTNKPGWLTDPLVANFPELAGSGCVISGDTLPVRKPDPAPLHLACEQLSVAPGKALYIGDAERDIQAGRNAGMFTLVASYGYLHRNDAPETWRAHGEIASLDELTTLLQD